MKKKLIILTVIFLLFLIPGLLLNTQRGLHFGDDFWREKDGMYICGSNRIHPFGDSFELMLDGHEMTVSMSSVENGAYRCDFSDGTALEFTLDEISSPMISVSDTLLSSDCRLILTDIAHPSLTYATPGETTVEYYTDETGKCVGEMSLLMSEDGEYITGYEWFYDSERPEEPKPVLLYDGIRLDYDNTWNTLYVNPDGDYLMDPDDLFYVRVSYDHQIGKQALARLLMDTAEGRTELRGIAWIALLYAAVYWLGAATILWPEQMAFFGSRWRYRTDPELSDDGLIFQTLGGYICIVGSLALLFMPLFL